MNMLVWIIATLWALRLIRNTLGFAALWFVKEYRFDRMKIHLSADVFRRSLFPQFRLPPKSLKAAMLTAGTLGVIFLFVFLLPGNLFVRFILADLVHFPLTAALVFALNMPTILVHRKKIAAATKLLREHPKLFVIGITGSFGKTSVKDYTAAILSSSFSVLKTQASKNSPIGIAEVVLSDLAKQEIFVVEMGAYKRGEIRDMADMVRPQIGILTAINAQHQDLFGSIENTMAAKYELLTGLTGKRIAILNADDARIRSMGAWAKRDGLTVWWYTRNSSSREIHDRTFFADNIQMTDFALRFTVHWEESLAQVEVSVVGEHQVSNVLAAIAAGVACGMSLQQAARAGSRIVPAKGVLSMEKGINGATFIDDTFNNNPDAAKAALDVLEKQTGRKVLVFQPMIELGAYAEESHRDVGAYAGKICDSIILTNASWHEDFLAGVRQTGAGVPVRVFDAGEASRQIRAAVRKGDTVLFKGKEAGLVLKKL